MPDFCVSAAFTATSSPPARAFAFFSGMATLFETMTSCPKGDPLRDNQLRLTSARPGGPGQHPSTLPAAPMAQCITTQCVRVRLGSFAIDFGGGGRCQLFPPVSGHRD